jgi:hypothetical protein
MIRMPTTIYDSSLITKRKQNTTIANSFISRIQNGNNSTTGSAPILGITEQSIINSVKNGQMIDFRKNEGGCTVINRGCPCSQAYSPVISAIIGWATSIGGTGIDAGNSIATDNLGNVYVTGFYRSASLIINSFVSGGSGYPITLIPFGTLSNSGESDIFIVKYNTNGLAQWATSIQGTDFDSGASIAIDNLGNVYVTGQYLSTSLTINDFVSQGSPINLTPYGILSNSGSRDVFIVKYNTNGLAQWATSIQGTGRDEGNSIATDNLGNVYVTGQYLSTSLTINDFVSQGSPINLTPYGTLSNSGLINAFIVKYNTNGLAQWATSIQGTGNDIGYGIATDNLGNVYVTGQYLSTSLTINDFVSQGSPINLTPYGTLSNSGLINAFIVKYNTNGLVQWATSIQGNNINIGRGIATDNLGNVYVTGSYTSTSLTINDFVSQGSPINLIPYGTLSNSGNFDVFIVKYNTNGLAQWATSIQGTDSDTVFGIATDNLGNVYVTGRYDSAPLTINDFVSQGSPINLTPYGTLSNSGLINAFIVKYNTNGLVQWATSIQGTDSAIGNSISTDNLGNVYVTGSYTSTPLTINNFVSQGSPINLTPYGTLSNSSTNSDVFIVRYNTNGQVL